MGRKFQKTMNQVLCYLLILVMFAGNVLPAVAEEESTGATLIAKYDFENVSGTTVPNEAEGAAGYTGILSGNNVSIEADTVFGNSLKFTDGTEGHMLVESILNTGTTSYSISLWYQYDTTTERGNKNTVLLQQSGSGRTLLTLTAANKYHSYVNATDIYTAGTVDAGSWQHVTYVYDSENQKVKFYINGILDSEQAAGSAEVDALTNLLIGRHKNGGSDPLSMRGLVDEICVYEGVVDDAKAQSIYLEKAGVLDSDTAPIVLTLDSNTVERTVDSSIFGINHRYAFNGYGSFDSYLMEVKDDFKELYEEAGFGSIRYPGGTISNLFNWKTSLDSVGRKKQIHGFYNNSGQGGIAPNFGIKEIADFADEVNSEIVYVYSLGRGSVQDAQDLIEYLNAEVGTNPNGGIDWAEVRSENGHEEPYNVRYFEIGNEMQQVYSDGTSSQGYWLHGMSDSETGYIEGGTASFAQQYAVCEEDWNQTASLSDGSANLVRYMRYANTNPKKYDENGDIVDDETFKAVVEGSVAVYVGSDEWTIVDSFENSSSTDTHVVIDYSTGAIKFGDGVNGAIPASGQQIYVTYQVERDGFVAISQAMKDTTEAINAANEANGVDVQHEAYVYSSYETSGFITKMSDGGYNDLYDGLTIHPYSGTPSGTGEEFYDSAMLKAENTGVQHVQNYVDMLPEGKVPVISEYGIFRSTDSLVRSQTHAIYIAKVLMEYVRLGSPYIQKHCLTDWYSSGADSLGPTQQAVIQVVAQDGANTTTGEGEFDFFATPSARVFQMLNSSFGEEIVASSFSREEALSNGVAAYSSLASKDEYGNYYVAVVNVDRENDKNMEVAVDGVDLTGADVTIQMLSSDSYADENTLEDPDNVAVETTIFVNEGSNVSLQIPKHSFAVVKIATGVDKTALEEAIADAKDLEEDDYTAESWTTANLAAVIEAAEVVLNNADATDNDVATALTNLENAAAALEAVTADKEALEAKIAEADALSEEDYTGASWSEMQRILSSAKTVAAKEDAAQEIVDKVLADLTAAMEALKAIIPVSAMTVTAGDSQSTDQGPDCVADNDTSTKWHTNWYGTSRDNHYLQFELTEEYIVDGLCYLPRQDSSVNGIITGYEIQVSDDAESWEAIAEGTWASDKEWKIVSFEGQNVKYVRLVATNSLSDSSYVFASAAEVRLTGIKEEISAENVTEVFTDVAEGAWYVPYVQYVYENGIMTGNEGVFTPTGTVTRAMVAETLYKMEGKPEVTDYSEYDQFTDLSRDNWWTASVAWAMNTDVATGDTYNMLFNPETAVTREQLATFLYRYANYKDLDTTQTGDLSGMLNADQVNSFAQQAITWAVGAGLISGIQSTGANGNIIYDLAPQAGASRTELAAVLMRFCEAYNL